ncbi:hypothetical protein [Clostridium botulinum]|uniref:hypothetical protein n=1 Tax=Clostridium botulinum TaxID=1491 RepID=UPI0007739E98|nr:hypothetical protein [Clostridium botulinum]APH20864.1 hypothetical protein NPD1_4159 [Clostridium botulinum]APQ71197.1 hypothetical protein RSJ8_4116 [Clostridium botulinum]MBN3379032.1 hypothetical protein [Clostridium botulinum]
MISSEQLIDKIETKDVIEILIQLGSKFPKKDSQGNLYFQTICHGGSKHKLHYFTESKMFMCYTNCGSMSLFDLLMTTKNWDFKEAFKFVANFKGISLYDKGVGLQNKKEDNEDLYFLNQHLYVPKKKPIVLPSFNKKILNIFDNYCPSSWINEGISIEIMKYYGIRFYFNQYKAIIPHYDIHGNLVGIRGRNFLQSEIDANRKYIPITIQNLTYRYPKNYNLYGIYQNQNNIKKYKKAIIFESEKSVLHLGSIHGQDKNISVATMGMTLSYYQRDLLINLGIEELIIALDKQYEIEYLIEDKKDTKQYKEYIKYLKNLHKIVKMFIDYCNVSIILCWDNRINYKDAPIDCGEKIFEQLMQERYIVEDLEEIESLIK